MAPEELHVNPIKDGNHIGWLGDADQVAVFTPDGDHLATLDRVGGGWEPSEIPGNPDAVDAGVRLDNEEEIREWAAEAL